jgi:hypothetical protein
MSIGPVTGEEAQEETELFVRATSDYFERQVGKPIPSEAIFITDGAVGLRLGCKRAAAAEDVRQATLQTWMHHVAGKRSQRNVPGS